ncbi:zinc finger BED domain-containing protein RICESLEEPER 2-like [Abrus precatorius]|uniref:Zinc finger BED domain-containing protein RICESLEEPER 2-like n=1 Tax=Abrus precatorius TaxID=3816 RepID=A0A8B8KIR1_ABRPR|nr:zinc finger BED domain-containing protein RICESLEEPER 2-like [Abrus precatorius]
MSSPLEGNEAMSSSTRPPSNLNVQALTSSSQLQDNSDKSKDQNDENCVIKRKRQKTSAVWNDFIETEISGGVTKAICKYCKSHFSHSGKVASTSHMKRHAENCLQKRLHIASQKKQPTIPFQPSNLGVNPFVTPDVRYSNEKMREIIATTIMVHEYPFNIVEDEVWIWGFQYANPEFSKVSCKIARSDCIKIYEAKKKNLKLLLKGWNLQKRVLSFVKVPAPRRGIDVADAIFKCLKVWRIEDKVFFVSVDNASYNDSCLRNLKDNLSLDNKLVLDGKLFHVRCCAHILNLLVHDGLGRIKDIIHNIRESVKYINYNDSRLKVFCDIVEQKHLKEKKLILDCPTRWNSTFKMLSTALKFKIVFPTYKEKEPHYTYEPSQEDWEKVEKVCQLLKVFNLATHVISGSDYPTANLYLPEVWRVDKAAEDEDYFMREMVAVMKVKFDKYWGECNLLMAIASVLDPRCNFYVVNYCFSLIYKPEYVAKENVDMVMTSLEMLYEEYFELSKKEASASISGEVDNSGNNSSFNVPSSGLFTGFEQIMSIVREKQAIPPMKSELEVYLEEGLCIPDSNSNSFSALEWWKNNSLKYKILSEMAADILTIPISIVALESTFSARGRVIDEFHSRLNEESIAALICGGDWLRNKYNLKKIQKVLEFQEEDEIILKI